MAPRAPSRRTDGTLRRALVRFAALVLLLAAGFWLVRAASLDSPEGRERVMAELDAIGDAWWAPLALVGAYVVAAPLGIPVSPLMLAGGAVFGPLFGWGLNVLGCWLGALATFGVARALGRDLIARLLGTERMDRVESLLDTHGFWALFRSRFLPLPFALVNYGAALSGFRFTRFATATFLGLVPSLLVYTYLGHVLVDAASANRAELARNALLAMAGFLLLSFIGPAWRWLRRRRSESGEGQPADDRGDEPQHRPGAGEEPAAEGEAARQNGDRAR